MHQAAAPPSFGRATASTDASFGAAFCFDLYTMSKIERRALQPQPKRPSTRLPSVAGGPEQTMNIDLESQPESNSGRNVYS